MNAWVRSPTAHRAPVAYDATKAASGLVSRDILDSLLGRSAFAQAPTEGLVVRNLDGGPPRLAKHVDPVWPAAGGTAGENDLAVPLAVARS